MQTTNFTKHEFLFIYFLSIFTKQNYGILSVILAFLMHFNLNSKLLPGKGTKKVNKQINRCKKSGFVLVVRMLRLVSEFLLLRTS